MLQELTTAYNYALAHKEAILAVFGGSAGISVLAQAILHKINVKWSVNSKPFSYTLVQVLTAAAALSAYLVDNANVGVLYPWLAVAAATVHRYLVSPYYTKKVLPYLTFLNENAAQPTSQYQPPQIEAPETVQESAPSAFVS